MELRHLKYFAAVARERGFGRAAAVLHLAQPALSRQIRDLEEEIGVPLLERTPKGVDVTPAGQAFLAGTTTLLQTVDEALIATHRAAAGHEGRCVLAVGRMMMATEAVSAAVMELHDVLPGVEIAMEEIMALDQLEHVAQGRIDVGIGVQVDGDPRLISEPWLVLPIDGALLAVDHPLATRDVIDPDDLANEPMAMVSAERAPELASELQHAIERAGIRSPREFYYATPQTAAMVVASGRGWGPGHAGARHRPPPGTVNIPVRGFLAEHQTYLTWRTDESRPVVHTVLDVMRAMRDGRLGVTRPTVRAVQPPIGLPPGLELRHFRYFVAVADEGGFGRAAELLGMSQPALSRQVADLEDLVRAPLLDRGGRGVELTDAGRALRNRLTSVFAAYDGLVGVAAQARRGLAGRCVIGTIHTVAASRIVARTLSRTHERWPGLELVFEDYPTAHQPAALREGLIDIGLCHSYPGLTDDPLLMRETLVEDEIMGALVAEDHPLAERTSLDARELADIPFLFIRRAFHAPFHDHMIAVLAGLGLTPRIDGPFDAIHMAWAIAAEGKGWTLAFASHTELPPSGLKAIPVTGLHVPWGLDLLWRRDEVNVAVGRVLNLLREARTHVAGGRAAPNVAQAGSIMSRRRARTTA